MKFFFILCIELFELSMYHSSSQVNEPTISRTCSLKPDPGPCRADLVMYYFNPQFNDCDKFVWGGCQGNGNRFNYLEDCKQTCKPEKEIKKPFQPPSYCLLTYDYGLCFGNDPRWYYDKFWKVCKENIYSGCGGNDNNFLSLEKCDATCIGKEHYYLRISTERPRLPIIIHTLKQTTYNGPLLMTDPASPEKLSQETFIPTDEETSPLSSALSDTTNPLLPETTLSDTSSSLALDSIASTSEGLPPSSTDETGMVGNITDSGNSTGVTNSTSKCPCIGSHTHGEDGECIPSKNKKNSHVHRART